MLPPAILEAGLRRGSGGMLQQACALGSEARLVRQEQLGRPGRVTTLETAPLKGARIVPASAHDADYARALIL
jgi:hypothetical protein